MQSPEPPAQRAGILYVVATPVGNLEDISLRALRLLKECDLICAEDTRVTRKLLARYDIHTPILALHQHSAATRIETIRERLRTGSTVCLVTDAGTPLVSDPGADLTSLAIQDGVTVSPVPGASAVLAALTISGLPVSRFAFDGFPPRTKTDRLKFFQLVAGEKRAVVLFEAPSRLASTLRELLEAAGDRQVAICRELTKHFEDVYRGPLSGALDWNRTRNPKGEYAIVIAPAVVSRNQPINSDDEISELLKIEIVAGKTPRDAVQSVAKQLGAPRKAVYALMTELVNSDD
jgi:16S rRNA (cytidine1402-2'-O)-methyltransferase